MIKKIKKYIRYIQRLLENDKRFIDNEEYKYKYKIKSLINNIQLEDDPIYDDLKIDITNLYNHNKKKKYTDLQNKYTDMLNKYTTLKDITLKDLTNNYTDILNKYTTLKNTTVKDTTNNENTTNNGDILNKYNKLKKSTNNFYKIIYERLLRNNKKLLFLKDLLLQLSSK